MSDDKRDEPQDLRKELNQLWRSTLDQFDDIKDAIVRSSSAGKAKLDATFLKRQREKLISELGARVLELHQNGEITLPESLRFTVARIDELDGQIEEQESEVDRLLHKDGPREHGSHEGKAASEANGQSGDGGKGEGKGKDVDER